VVGHRLVSVEREIKQYKSYQYRARNAQAGFCFM
jgi:hypothetical protein